MLRLPRLEPWLLVEACALCVWHTLYAVCVSVCVCMCVSEREREREKERAESEQQQSGCSSNSSDCSRPSKGFRERYRERKKESLTEKIIKQKIQIHIILSSFITIIYYNRHHVRYRHEIWSSVDQNTD